LSGFSQYADKAEIYRLQKENNFLKEKLEERDSNPLAFDGHVYRDAAGFPYCTACYDDKGKRVHLQEFVCPVCQNRYKDKDAPLPPAGGRRGGWNPLEE